MKHQAYIEKFIKNSDEFDDCECYVAWLPDRFNGIMEGEYADILAGYIDSGHGYALSFIVASPDDEDRDFLTFGDFPYSVQKALVTYFHENA